MKRKTNIKLNLTDAERKSMRLHKIKKDEILEYAPDELAGVLSIPEVRAKELYALADFQQIPSVGIEFSKDLIFLGYYNIEELKEKNGAELLDRYEKEKGYKTDPCVEDQFRLVAHFALHKDYSKNWWSFTSERKNYRAKFGYPSDRPKTNWTEVIPIKIGSRQKKL